MTLVQIQDRLKEIVESASTLAGRTVFTDSKDNLASQIENALATVSLAVAVAASSGETKSGGLRARNAWSETFEIVIHRSVIEDNSTPSTVAVLDELIGLLTGAPLLENDDRQGLFETKRHELRENLDGTYARVLTVGCVRAVSLKEA